MHGDFTRNTFDPAKNYSRVLMQQGRVTLDADWNEQASILLYQLRTFIRDVFGDHAGPAVNAGFELVGLLDGPSLQSKLTSAPLNLPAESARFKQVVEAIKAGDVLIAPGRYYVDGLMIENVGPILYSELASNPFGDDSAREELRAFPRGLLFYLDVWERHVTHLQDDHIREVALGGPDTCTRAQVYWQLRVLRQDDSGRAFDCRSVDDLRRKKPGVLRARADDFAESTELCVIAPESRYRGPENQLYRVEIHRSAVKGGKPATFKWSRENGSVAFAIKSLQGTTATLQSLGRDRRTTLSPGDWVEIVDEEMIARDVPGPLAQVDLPPDRDSLKVTLKPAAGVVLPTYTASDSRQPILRRWDHRGDASEGGAVKIEAKPNTPGGLPDGWVELEDGVQVWFEQDGDYRAGDYWLIPARVAIGDVEWPFERELDGRIREVGGQKMRQMLPPRGPRHHYAPIWLSLPPPSGGSTQRRYQDCRCRIQRLPCSYTYAFGAQAIGPDFPE